MTRTGKLRLKCSALCATVAVALCISSLPAVALVSEGTRCSVFVQDDLPPWPDNLLTGAANKGLPTMTLQSIGSLPPPVPRASATSQASRTPAAIVPGPKLPPSQLRIRPRKVIYARLKIRPRSANPRGGAAVFVGGLY